MNRPLTQQLGFQIWVAFFWRFLLWIFLLELLAAVCMYLIMPDPWHPSWLITVLRWIVDFAIVALTSYSAIKAALRLYPRQDTVDV